MLQVVQMLYGGALGRSRYGKNIYVTPAEYNTETQGVQDSQLDSGFDWMHMQTKKEVGTLNGFVAFCSTQRILCN